MEKTRTQLMADYGELMVQLEIIQSRIQQTKQLIAQELSKSNGEVKAKEEKEEEKVKLPAGRK